MLAKDPNEGELHSAEEVDAQQERRRDSCSRFQNLSLATRYPKATRRLRMEMVNPSVVSLRRGTFEWLVMPGIAMAYEPAVRARYWRAAR